MSAGRRSRASTALAAGALACGLLGVAAAAPAAAAPRTDSARSAASTGAVNSTGSFSAGKKTPLYRFGTSVAVSGPLAVVGAPGLGYVYLFTDDGDGWVQTVRLAGRGTLTTDGFGYSVAISGTTLAVGAPYHDDKAGRVYIFSYSAEGWNETTSFTGSDTKAKSEFGASVALANNTLLVGEPDGHSKVGRAFVFTDEPSGWVQTAELRPSGAGPGAQVGNSVAISPTTAVIGAQDAGSHGSLSGMVFVYTLKGGEWTQTSTLTPPDVKGNDFFGSAVAVAGTHLVVGASQSGPDGLGRVYVYRPVAASWTLGHTLTPTNDPEGTFGASLAMTPTSIVVGAPLGGLNEAGSASLFEQSGSNWVPEATFQGSGTVPADHFGASVGVSESTIVAGAPYHSDFSGRAYAYSFTPVAP